MTEAEVQLWQRLRGHGIGWHFRRQHPIPPYVVDFACVAARLAVELDGGQHAGSAHDEKRDAALRSQGWLILRFWNPDVMTNVEGVLEAIRAACLSRAPPPNPPPQAGEG